MIKKTLYLAAMAASSVAFTSSWFSVTLKLRSESVSNFQDIALESIRTGMFLFVLFAFSMSFAARLVAARLSAQIEHEGTRVISFLRYPQAYKEIGENEK